MKPDETLAWVRSYVEDNPGATVREIAAAMIDGGTPDNRLRARVQQALTRLRDRGEAEADKDGASYRWRVTEAGEVAVRLSQRDARLAAHVLRTYINRGELGDPSAQLLARIEAQLPKPSDEATDAAWR